MPKADQRPAVRTESDEGIFISGIHNWYG